MLRARGISLSVWCIVVAERNARRRRCARLITFDAASSIEISFSAIYNWCKLTAWKGILSHNSPIDEIEVLSANYSLVMCFCAAPTSKSHSLSSDPSLRKHNTLEQDKKKHARVRDRIHKKFLFWEPNAHSPFQARCLNYSSIRRQGAQFETHKVIPNHDYFSRMIGKCAILLFPRSWLFIWPHLLHSKFQFLYELLLWMRLWTWIDIPVCCALSILSALCRWPPALFWESETQKWRRGARCFVLQWWWNPPFSCLRLRGSPQLQQQQYALSKGGDILFLYVCNIISAHFPPLCLIWCKSTPWESAL